MNQEQRAFLQDVLIRIERGMTMRRDADWLWALIQQLEGDIANLTAIIEKETDIESDNTDTAEISGQSTRTNANSTRQRQFDGAGTA